MRAANQLPGDEQEEDADDEGAGQAEEMKSAVSEPGARLRFRGRGRRDWRRCHLRIHKMLNLTKKRGGVATPPRLQKPQWLTGSVT